MTAAFSGNKNGGQVITSNYLGITIRTQSSIRNEVAYETYEMAAPAALSTTTRARYGSAGQYDQACVWR